MSSFFPFLTSTPRKRSTSTDSVTLDSSAIDVDRISLVSHDSTNPDEEKDDSSDLYMSVQASPTGSCEEEEESYLTASSTRSRLSKVQERRSNETKITYSPTSLFPDGPAWFDLQKEILKDREERITGKTEDEDLFDLGSLVSGMREELRWMQSLAADERMRGLIAQLDSSYNPLEGPSSTTDETDLIVRLKNAPAINSVVIPCPIAGIDAVTIEKRRKVPPHEIVQRVLLNDYSSKFPRDKGTDDWLRSSIELSNMLLAPSMSSSAPSSSTNRSVTTVSNGLKGVDPILASIGGHMRVKDQWMLEVHPSRTPQKVLESQGNRCADCGRILEGEYAKRIRYCEYYGAVFCLCCSFSGKGVVPARILQMWNFREFPLSDRAEAFLSQIYAKPVIRMNAASPVMMEKMRSLKLIVALRPRLRHASTYVRYCALAARDVKTGQSLPDLYAKLEKHLVEEDDVFSINDLIELRAGDLHTRLEGAFVVAREHVEKCRRPENELVSVCKDRAFTCWLCSSEADLIFSFQTDRAIRCAGCGSFSHMNCYRKAQKDNRGFEPECPKCKRMQESRIRRRFISSFED